MSDSNNSLFILQPTYAQLYTTTVSLYIIHTLLHLYDIIRKFTISAFVSNINLCDLVKHMCKTKLHKFT